MDGPALQSFVQNPTEWDTIVHADEAAASRGLPRQHETVKHSVEEYARDMAHANAVESHWTMLKRVYHGTYQQVSEKHLPRYVNELTGRHNFRCLDTEDQLTLLVQKSVGKRLTYQ